MLKLYSYFRSSAAYRVRIALALKDIPYELIPVHLVRDGGEHRKPEYQELNPQKLVPTLVDETHTLSQSLAILDYLETKHPTPALLPIDPVQRAHVLQWTQIIGCDIHPLDNLRVLQYLTQTLSVTDTEKMTWYHHWLKEGFEALETLAHTHSGMYCCGDTLSWADLYLIPQLYNAFRFKLPMDAYPRLTALYERCTALEAFQKACPEAQPDAV